MSARHILSFAQTLAGGGVERVLLTLARGWTEAGRRVTLVIGDARGPLAAELSGGVETVVLGSARYLDLLRAMPGIVRTERPDVIFCPGNHYTSIIAWTRLRLGRGCPPVVAKLSNSLVRPDQSAAIALGYRAWLRLHPRFVDALVAMTPGMAGEAAQRMAMPHERINVIANPAMVRADAASVALPKSRFLLGVGRLAPQKRWDRAIAALCALDDDVDLVVLGEGEQRAPLERQAAALGLAARVHLPGYADPAPAMVRAAAVVLTSDFEGVPGVLREALAAGTPVVATDSSVAIREIVTTPAQGDVVTRDDPAALVAALKRWLAPYAVRPSPVAVHDDAARAYLALFDSLSSSS